MSHLQASRLYFSLSLLPFQLSTSVELLCICCLDFSFLDVCFDSMWSSLHLHLSREDTPLKTTKDPFSRGWHQLPAITPTALTSNEVTYLQVPVRHSSILKKGPCDHTSKWSTKYPLWLPPCNSLLLVLPERQSRSPIHPILILQLPVYSKETYSSHSTTQNPSIVSHCILDTFQTPNPSVSHGESYLLFGAFPLVHTSPNFFQTPHLYPVHASVYIPSLLPPMPFHPFHSINALARHPAESTPNPTSS